MVQTCQIVLLFFLTIPRLQQFFHPNSKPDFFYQVLNRSFFYLKKSVQFRNYLFVHCDGSQVVCKCSKIFNFDFSRFSISYFYVSTKQNSCNKVPIDSFLISQEFHEVHALLCPGILIIRNCKITAIISRFLPVFHIRILYSLTTDLSCSSKSQSEAFNGWWIIRPKYESLCPFRWILDNPRSYQCFYYWVISTFKFIFLHKFRHACLPSNHQTGNSIFFTFFGKMARKTKILFLHWISTVQ